jgi:hypothetical protein
MPRHHKRKRVTIKRTAEIVDNKQRPVKDGSGRIITETSISRKKIYDKERFSQGKDPRAQEKKGKIGPGTRVSVRWDEPFENAMKRFKRKIKRG